MECDASGMGVGAVLMSLQQPITYMSKALKGRALSLSTYAKELFALVTVVQKWRPYFLGRPFTVKTNQQVFKFLLEQRVGMAAQQKWLGKLMSYDVVISYKKVKENNVADTLSKQMEGKVMTEETLAMISFPTPEWVEKLKDN